MANTINVVTLQNGSKNLVLNVYISGDGSGDEVATQLVDASAYGASTVVLENFWSSLTGFTAELLWDADTNVPFIHLPNYDSSYTPEKANGINNTAGAGKTGDVLITTAGLGANDKGTIILRFKKKPIT